MTAKSLLIQLLKRDSDDCSGSSQMCETGTDTTNTLAICLAVIIPVVVVIIIITFFIIKAYKRNKKEALEDNDPDFNGDNIILPEYDYNNVNNISNMNLNKEKGFDSSDSLGNPFDEKTTNEKLSHPSPNYKFTTSANAITLPYGDSKEDLDQYARNLGMDFHEFNYPISKINSPTRSLRSSRNNSRHTSFDSKSRPFTGYGIASPNSSPLKKDNFLTINKPTDSNIVDDSNTFISKDQYSQQSLHTAHDTDLNEDKIQNPFNNVELKDVSKSASFNEYKETSPSTSSQISSSGLSDSNKNTQSYSSPHTTMTNDTSLDTPMVPELKNSAVRNELVNASTDQVQTEENVMNDEEQLPDFKQLADKDSPLSPEEEEQLNRMKSVYKVYFSRNNSVKSKSENNVSNEHELPPLPKLSIPVDDYDVEAQPVKENEEISKNVLTIPGSSNGENNDDFRASVSSSVYLPSSGNVNTNTTAGQFAHQQFGQIIPRANENSYSQQQSQQYYPQQYPQQYPNGYPQNQQHDQYYQQYYQQYPQMYQQQYQQYGGYPASQRTQQYAPGPKRLPKLETLPLPHQLNKRTSTLESFTTFSAQSHKNPVTNPGIQIDQNFDPIQHVNWKNKGEAAPSPSQIRDSIVMFHPMGLTDNRTFVSKGTAKERVRELQKQQKVQGTDGYSIPSSPSLNSPLYGFYDHVVERPHGAENLIPQSRSQADLRKKLDNANV